MSFVHSLVRQIAHLIDDPAAIVFVRTTDGQYVFVNEAYERQLHLTQAQVLGKANEEIYGSEDSVNWQSADSFALALGVPVVTVEAWYDPSLRRWRKFSALKWKATDPDTGDEFLVGVSVEATDGEVLVQQRLANLQAGVIAAWDSTATGRKEAREADDQRGPSRGSTEDRSAGA
ncbi:PAS domain-containing protein [Pilimelia columellifera]|uniref:PAS domain-containing protein n=1 Tax=Pilimelia columellifera subsp. columellifera TaxID=706583 RepID=A0ABN3NN09_9ACTN